MSWLKEHFILALWAWDQNIFCYQPPHAEITCHRLADSDGVVINGLNLKVLQAPTSSFSSFKFVTIPFSFCLSGMCLSVREFISKICLGRGWLDTFPVELLSSVCWSCVEYVVLRLLWLLSGKEAACSNTQSSSSSSKTVSINFSAILS